MGVSARNEIIADIEKRLATCLDKCTSGKDQAIIMAENGKLTWGTVHWDDKPTG